MTREEAHDLIDKLFNLEEGKYLPDSADYDKPEEGKQEKRKLPEGKRVVRTKSSGDRVYLLDEAKKTRRWVTNAKVLEGLGFKFEDVSEVDDTEMLKYQMGPALYRVEDGQTKT